MKIAIFRPDSNVASRAFYNSQEVGLARGLATLGVNVDVYIAGKEKEIVRENIPSEGPGILNLVAVPFFKVPEIDHAIYPKLNSELKKNNYDLIQVNEENELACFMVAKFAKAKGIPVVVYQGMYKPIGGRLRALFQGFYNIFLRPSFKRSISRALVKTSRAKQYLLSCGYDDPLVIPVGLDSSPFDDPENRNWRQELEIPEEHEILLYVGVFENRRNIHLLLDIASNFKDKPISLLLAGDGEIFSEIEQRIESEALSNVRLLGKVSQKHLPSLYQDASLFLLASDYEIYGMVVLEAMYFGTPVVSTPTAGPEDIIKSGENGCIVEGTSVSTWVSAIDKILFVDKSKEGMSQSAANTISQHLVWTEVAKRYKSEVIDAYTQSTS